MSFTWLVWKTTLLSCLCLWKKIVFILHPLKKKHTQLKILSQRYYRLNWQIYALIEWGELKVQENTLPLQSGLLGLSTLWVKPFCYLFYDPSTSPAVLTSVIQEDPGGTSSLAAHWFPFEGLSDVIAPPRGWTVEFQSSVKKAEGCCRRLLCWF